MTVPIFSASKNIQGIWTRKNDKRQTGLEYAGLQYKGEPGGRRPNGGFTLVEMMVVILVTGLAIAAIMVNIPGEQAGLRSDAERLAIKIAAARDHAILGGRPMAIWFRPSGYGFERRQNGHWQAINDPMFRDGNWQGRTIAKMTGKSQTRVIFDVTGLPSSPADIGLQNGDASMIIRLSASGNVKLVH